MGLRRQAQLRAIRADLNIFPLRGNVDTRLRKLAAQCEAFLADTERLYEDVLGRAAREQLGLSLDELARWDLQRMIRSPQWDEGFPGDRMVPALKATLNDLGIDLDRQANIHLDIDRQDRARDVIESTAGAGARGSGTTASDPGAPAGAVGASGVPRLATSTPTGFGLPWMGPLPSMPTTPSTIAKWRGKVA